MSIRPAALKWFAEHHRVARGRVLTSKLYQPDESWTGDFAWWIQIPIGAIEKDEMLYLLCQRRNKAGAFHYLRVPAKFIRDRLDEFAVINGSHVNLFLDAADEPFIDRRGPGLVAFARFEVE